MSKSSLEEETTLLVQIRNWAAPLAFGGYLFAFFNHGSIAKVFTKIETLDFDPVDFFIVLIDVYLLTLVVLWVYSGTTELNMLLKQYRPRFYRQRRPILNILALISIGPILGIIASFSGEIHIFCTLFAVYLLVDLALWYRRRTEIAHGMRDTITEVPEPGQPSIRTSKKWRSAHAVIRKYYFERPHCRRVSIFLLYTVVMTAASYALRESYLSCDRHGAFCGLYSWLAAHVGIDRLRMAFYGSFLIVSWGSEYVIARWRKSMEDDLRIIHRAA
jgi:hypothetical protein